MIVQLQLGRELAPLGTNFQQHLEQIMFAKLAPWIVEADFHLPLGVLKQRQAPEGAGLSPAFAKNYVIDRCLHIRTDDNYDRYYLSC